MIFTDGQLLTATDINQFLLNRETNPELDKAKTQALQRIQELKTSIPSGKKQLSNLPSNFVTDAVIQNWKLSFTTDSSQWRENKVQVNLIPDVQVSDCPLLCVYKHEIMRIPTFGLSPKRTIFLSEYEGNPFNLNSEYSKYFYISSNPGRDKFLGDIYFSAWDDSYKGGTSMTWYFITINKRMNLRVGKINTRQIERASIEEVPDDLTKLLAA